jgi:iron complex outermembrane receptor protein
LNKAQPQQRLRSLTPTDCRRRTIVILVLAGLIGLGIPARRACAEGAASTNQSARELADLGLAELMNVPVYAASRHEQTVSEVPAAVTVITHDDIQKYGYRT